MVWGERGKERRWRLCSAFSRSEGAETETRDTESYVWCVREEELCLVFVVGREALESPSRERVSSLLIFFLFLFIYRLEGNVRWLHRATQGEDCDLSLFLFFFFLLLLLMKKIDRKWWIFLGIFNILEFRLVNKTERDSDFFSFSFISLVWFWLL